MALSDPMEVARELIRTNWLDYDEEGLAEEIAKALHTRDAEAIAAAKEVVDRAFRDCWVAQDCLDALDALLAK